MTSKNQIIPAVIGENFTEIKNKRAILFTRDTGKKEVILIKDLSKLRNLGEKFDERLRKKADKFMNEKIVNSKTKDQIKKAINDGKIARINWCSELRCAENIEKEINAEVRGTLANKREKPKGKCVVCNKPAREVVYVAKSY